MMWGIPAFMVVRGYFKMNADDRKSESVKSAHFIFGFSLVGLLLFHWEI